MSAGEPWNSQPTRPGIESPFFMPVPAKIQWSGLETVQSPEPLNGLTVCAPMSVASLGASRGRSAIHFSSPGRIPPYRPARVMIRFDTPVEDTEYGATKQHALPDKKQTLTPPLTAAIT